MPRRSQSTPPDRLRRCPLPAARHFRVAGSAWEHPPNTDPVWVRPVGPVIEAVCAEYRTASKAEGRIEGKAEAKIEALITILAARGIAPSAALERIVEERGPNTLNRWIARAAAASTLAEVFDGV